MKVVHLGSFQIVTFGHNSVQIIVILFIYNNGQSAIGYVHADDTNWLRSYTKKETMDPQAVCDMIYHDYMMTHHSVMFHSILERVYNIAFKFLKQILVTLKNQHSLLQAIQNIKPFTDHPELSELYYAWCQEESNNRLQQKKARQIQQYWKRIVTDPNHPICQRRLLHEFNTLLEY